MLNSILDIYFGAITNIDPTTALGIERKGSQDRGGFRREHGKNPRKTLIICLFLVLGPHTQETLDIIDF